MSDAFWVATMATVSAIASIVGPIVLAWMQQRAVLKAAEVKEALIDTTAVVDQKLDKIVEVASDTHILVNSSMGMQLKLNAATTKRLAELTGLDDDIKAADQAAKLYAAHVKKQAIVDAGLAIAKP